MVDIMSRRRLMQVAGAAAMMAGATPLFAAATRKPRVLRSDFLWGAATAGHQVEGGNVNSDSWVSEHLKPSAFAEPSGDACDSWNRWREDIDIVKRLGLNTYRFGIEWSRIEPERGEWSLAALAHYRQMLDYCAQLGLRALVTYSHFTVPRWFAAAGGWEEPSNVDLFVRFCEKAARALGDGYSHALTFNEPNLAAQLSWQPEFRQAMPMFAMGNAAAARQVGSDRFSSTLTADQARAVPHQIVAHQRAVEAIKSVRPDLQLGLSLSMADEQAGPGKSALQRKIAEVYAPWFEAVAKDDFVGVQTYGRAVVGPDGDLPPLGGVELTQTGMEFYPEALEATVKWAAKATGRPIIVTENGVATGDDSRRIAFIDRALAGLGRAVDAGVDVRGYIHWSLLDNFEWNRAYTARFGLVSVDRNTFARTIKPSGSHLGTYARTNRI
ncbi:glycoside hydrolase family 1 protein [Novosphingobium sp. ZW T3_23]|uniref:glycoside hydrolase family 1 protein n=1 Tax=Novosphingobium sp. ZW T3_23 TaxID=3378084 RepID=UPI0038546B40